MMPRKSNPPPATPPMGATFTVGVYVPVGGDRFDEEFYDEDLDQAISRAVTLSVAHGMPIFIRFYESDGEGDWLWGPMFSLSGSRVDYVLPEDARPTPGL